ncbi:MAG: glutamyl-tRNA reductase [Desulfatiglans sp.]|jgi:glutamyl-tRNA reductase|nr:glutamyl-tRNA reductase [Thermodesulfobacteriota bacterium]MEE4351999.1 glutamyl-tRNA reductase [Desulfatiglans sp.]
MKIINIGMNHESAPVELRERLASKEDNSAKAVALLRDIGCVKEGLFLSTCNRVEAVVTTDDDEKAKRSIISLMSKLGEIPEESFISNLYIYEDTDAVRHLFRVASSLDSMVVGEAQILGQIKDAYSLATQQKTSGVIINRLMHKAFHVAKRVRTETGICEAAVSVSYAAVELAKKIFYELDGKKVLLIGAGDMAELAAKHLMAQGVSSMVVANRTIDRAIRVARNFDASPISFDEIGAHLRDAHIVVSSTASEEYVITYDQVKKSLKKRRNHPLFFIDIAVPRDVQPEVNNLPNVYVYDIDDLKGVVRQNMAQRREEALVAERIVQEEVIKFKNWLETLEVVPTIISLRERAESIIRTELKRGGPALKNLSSAQQEAVQGLVRSVAEKILNNPILYLKKKAGRKTLDTYLDMTRKLFDLDDNH